MNLTKEEIQWIVAASRAQRYGLAGNISFALDQDKICNTLEEKYPGIGNRAVQKLEKMLDG